MSDACEGSEKNLHQHLSLVLSTSGVVRFSFVASTCCSSSGGRKNGPSSSALISFPSLLLQDRMGGEHRSGSLRHLHAFRTTPEVCTLSLSSHVQMHTHTEQCNIAAYILNMYNSLLQMAHPNYFCTSSVPEQHTWQILTSYNAQFPG